MKDWVECSLGEIFKTVTGNTPSKSEKDNYGSEIPFVKPPQIDNNYLRDSLEFLSPKGKAKARILPINSVLVTCIGNLGRIGLNKKEVAFNQQINAIEPLNGIEPKYTFYQAQSTNFRNQLESLSTSTTVALVNKSSFNSVKFKVAPTPIQKAIVRKIEELFSSLDSGIADLKKAQEQLVIYRQAVLKKAFEGELTNRKQKNLELPDGWKRETIRSVCDNIKVGIVIKPTNFYSKDEGGIKVFRSANVREFRVNDSNWVYFSKEGNDINKRTQVHTGDVLLVRTGYPGTSCVVREKFNDTNAIDILIATPNQEKILPDFLCAFNNSPLGKGLFSKGSQGVAQKHLNVGVYGKLLISYPSIPEQIKILKEIESRLSVCDKVEESLKESLEKAKALRQSILKKAFEGKLLSAEELAKCKADQDYEPASVLLEKIKKEKKKNCFG